MVFQNDILAGAAGAAGGYTIDQSIRFNDNDSAYLTRTPGSAGNRRTWTWSAWVKLGNLTIDRSLFSANADGCELRYAYGGSGADNLRFYNYSGSYTNDAHTSALYRDPSSWYHVVLAVDTTQATASNRIKIYVNGVDQILVDGLGAQVAPAQNTELGVNTTSAHYIGRFSNGASRYMDGYMAEIHFIDGTALDPTSFGKVNSDTGQWVPIAYTGSYGTNGFYITGEDSADLGADDSGNGNDFTSSGLTTADQLTDTPTDNFPTLNPLATGMATTLYDGNLAFSFGSDDGAPATFATGSTGSYRFRVNITTLGAPAAVAVITPAAYDAITNWGFINLGEDSGQYAYRSNGDKYSGGSAVAYGASFTSSDYVEAEYDANAGTLVFYKNGTTQGTAYTGLSGPMFFAISRNASGGGSVIGTVDFGQLGTVGDTNVLSTATLPDPTIADPSAHFNSVAYAGDGSIGRSIDAGLATDLVWIKERDGASDHALFDQVRGALKNLSPNTTGAETTSLANTDVSAFNSSGVVVNPSYFVNVNSSGFNYISWHWKANGTGSSNTEGSVTSTVSANQTAGFSIATFQKPAADTNQTVGHGLGTTPAMTILRWRSGTGGPASWYVWHQSFSSVGFLRLQGTDAFTADTTVFSSAPSSTVVNTGTAIDSDTDTTEFVMYNFAEVEGFSKFGSYTGTANADGPFVYCGFRPSWVLIKQATTSARDWIIQDATRNPYNVTNLQLLPNTSQAEATTFFSQSAEIDILSNGFKVRSSAARVSESGATYIVAAFAESPFKTANAR
jgi:hypothetical protein